MSEPKKHEETSSLLISTRLRPPTLEESLVVRPRLLDELLNLDEAGKLAVLNTPAGYGKSMLMSQCFKTYSEAGWLTAWLTLEEVDNDTDTFAMYLSNMFDGLQGNCAPTIRLGTKTGAINAVSSLLNLVEQSGRKCAFFFDDFHVLSNESLLEFFHQLVTHLSEAMNVVIGSRTSLPLPLSKLRTNGKLVSLGIDDLRFDKDETSQLYLRSNNLEIDQALLDSLHDQTGGWVVVMQLAAISLKNVKDKSAFIEQFSSSDKPISEFLNEEFMSIIKPEAANFLRQISIADRVCPDLCKAITGEDNPNASLDGLDSLGCLVQNLGSAGKWFRLHPIVRDYLVKELEHLNPVEKESFHRRAAQWFESEGLIGEAIHHALNGSDEEHALELIEQGGTHLINTGYLAHLLSLVRRLPERVVESSLDVLVQLAWLEVLDANIPQTERLLSQIKQVLLKSGTNELVQWARAVEIEVALYLYDEKYTEGKKLIAEWMPKAPEESVRVIASLKQVDSYIKISEFNFEQARENARWVLNQPNSLHLDLTKSFAACVLSLVYHHRGLLKQGQISLEAYLKQLRQRVGDSSQAIVLVESMLAANLYQRGELAFASDLLEKNSKTHQQLVPTEHLLVLVPVRARMLYQSGDHNAALSYLRSMELLAEEKGWVRLESSVLNELIRIHIELGGVSQAKSAFDSVMTRRNTDEDKASAQFIQTQSCCEIARARILCAEGETKVAAKLIDEQLGGAIRKGRDLRTLELRVLLAKIHITAGDNDRAVDVLSEALKSDRENSCIQVFRDEGSAVINLLEARRDEMVDRSGEGFHVIWDEQISLILGNSLGIPVATQLPTESPVSSSEYLQMIEALTKRELEILKLLTMGLSNKEISSKLEVSPNTVKTHLQTCYGKLDVSRRTQAVVRLRELGIFD